MISMFVVIHYCLLSTEKLCSGKLIPCFMFSALESKLVSQFCEDENGALIYNRITNGPWNGVNGNGNNGHGENTNGYNGYGNNGNVYGNNGYGTNGNGNNGNNYDYKEEIHNQRRPSSRGRGDTFSLPISADPLPIQVSFSWLKYVLNTLF